MTLYSLGLPLTIQSQHRWSQYFAGWKVYNKATQWTHNIKANIESVAVQPNDSLPADWTLLFSSYLLKSFYAKYLLLGWIGGPGWQGARPMETLGPETWGWHIACHCGPRPDTGRHSDGDEEIYLTQNVGNCLEVWKSTRTQGLRLQIVMDSSYEKCNLLMIFDGWYSIFIDLVDIWI